MRKILAPHCPTNCHPEGRGLRAFEGSQPNGSVGNQFVSTAFSTLENPMKYMLLMYFEENGALTQEQR
jgi:hypothetical protein